MKEKILKNCKKYWYVIAFIIVGFIVLNKEPDYLVLKKNTFKVELGTPFNIKPETYLNTEKLDTDVKRQIFDFVNGAIYALDGSIQKVNKDIFILAPSNVEIDGLKETLKNNGMFPW